MEYIYILKNESYSKNIVKIGKTSLLNPKERAKQLYWGETGVPEHFNPIVFISVPNCTFAELEIHRRLDTYRKNKKREFFSLTPDIAKMVVISICVELFGKDSIVIDEEVFENLTIEVDNRDEKDENLIEIDINSLIDSPINTSQLSDEQKTRVFIIDKVLSDYFNETEESWIESMSRDFDPEREILIWEQIVKAYLKVTSEILATKKQKFEVYKILLDRSLMSPSKVLRKNENSFFSRKMIKQIISNYGLKHKPILIKKINE